MNLPKPTDLHPLIKAFRILFGLLMIYGLINFVASIFADLFIPGSEWAIFGVIIGGVIMFFSLFMFLILRKIESWYKPKV